jgi:lysozyme family protein
MSSFDLAIPIVLAHEGGYINDPDDPGCETKFGISKRSYPSLDIENLTEDEAKAIYKRDFWEYSGIKDQTLANKVFDMGVLVYPKTANRLLQLACAACGHLVVADGCLGPETLNAVNAVPPYQMLLSFKAELFEHFNKIIARNPHLLKYSDGWDARARS